MSVTWQGVSICKACRDDIAESGKALCPTCAALPVPYRSLSEALKTFVLIILGVILSIDQVLKLAWRMQIWHARGDALDDPLFSDDWNAVQIACYRFVPKYAETLGITVPQVPWNFWDKMFGVIGCGLIVSCLWAMWSLFR